MRAALGCALAVLLGACDYPQGDLELPEPATNTFATTAYPVLLRDCGFPACHGTHERFFQVFGPGRTRLSANTMPYDPATAQEIELTMGRARSMLTDPKGIEHALLLRKPLSLAAGGAGHGGDDDWGRAVYGAKGDEGYRVLAEWAHSKEAP